MPTVILSESRATEGDVELIHPETGELTVEAQVIADFLTHLDLSSVSEVEGIDEFAFDGECDDENGVAEKCQLLPGTAVAEAIDEDDLEAMFRDYLNREAKRVTEDPKATLESKARLAPFVDLLDEAYKKGAFSRMHKQPAGHNRAARQLTAMLHKGVIKHAKKGTGQGKNKDYTKDKGYATGGTPAGKKKVALFKGKNAGKIKKSAMKAKQKVAAESFDAESMPVFGLGVPIESVSYVAAVRSDASGRLAEAKKGGKLKAMGKPPMPKASGSTCEADAGTKPTTETRTIAEGARLAGQILGLNESRSGTHAAATKS